MRAVALLSLIALGACASGGSPTPSTPSDRTTRVMGTGAAAATVRIVSSTSASTTQVPYSIDRVWSALPVAYDSLKIPLTAVDAAKHYLGNEGMKVRQKLGSVSLSKYIDCGQAQIGPSADTYDVYLNVTTTAKVISPTETQIATTVESAARPLSFSQAYSDCSSKGTIEARISEIVAKRLAAAK